MTFSLRRAAGLLAGLPDDFAELVVFGLSADFLAGADVAGSAVSALTVGACVIFSLLAGTLWAISARYLPHTGDLATSRAVGEALTEKR